LKEYFFDLFEKKKPVTGKMHVEIPEDSSHSELKKINKVLKQTIASELGLKPKNIKLNDTHTGEANYVISTALTKEIRNVLKTVDFAVNVNENIVNNFENLPESCFGVLEIGDVRVNILFKKQNPFYLNLRNKTAVCLWKF
jgi:hypothetical protein